MGIRRAVVLFADIIGCSEVSNNCSIIQYDKFLSQFQAICEETVNHLFPKNEYSVEKFERTIKGDEICLILHSGSDIESDYFTDKDGKNAYLIKDINNAVLFAIGLQLTWLASKYNQERIKDLLLPRGIGVGINIGPVMFETHPAADRNKTSEGYAINLAKRIEGASRKGEYSKILVCKELRYLCKQNDIQIEFGNDFRFNPKGITTPPHLNEIKDIKDSNYVIKSPMFKLINNLKEELIESYYNTAMINEQEFWLRKLVG